MLENLKKYNTFTFVYDGILSDEIDGVINPRKEEMQKLCKDLINIGKTVYIITKRHNENYANGGSSYHLRIDESKEVIDFARGLNIQKGNIVFTGRELYSRYLSDVDTHCHIDSSKYEIAMLNTQRPSIKTLNIKEL